MKISIAEAMQRPFDNFGIIRLLLSLAVVVSHAPAASMLGGKAVEPLHSLTGFTLGEHAVNFFFVISGFLIAMSWERRANPFAFIIARFLRVWPALILAALFCVFAVGTHETSLPVSDYLRSSQIYKFLGNIIIQLKGDHTLPGVFIQNPMQLVMGTVWTLKYEVECYFGVLLLGLSGFLPNKWVILAVTLFFGGCVLAVDVFHMQASLLRIVAYRLRFLFCLGILMYVWRHYISLNWLIFAALAMLAVLLKSTPVYNLALFTAEAYGILFLAIAPSLSSRWIEPKADLSYGVYLLGWPVQQIMVQHYSFENPYNMLWIAIPASLILAYLSWTLAEKPALNLKQKLISGMKPWSFSLHSILNRK